MGCTLSPLHSTPNLGSWGGACPGKHSGFKSRSASSLTGARTSSHTRVAQTPPCLGALNLPNVREAAGERGLARPQAELMARPFPALHRPRPGCPTAPPSLEQKLKCTHIPSSNRTLLGFQHTRAFVNLLLKLLDDE